MNDDIVNQIQTARKDAGLVGPKPRRPSIPAPAWSMTCARAGPDLPFTAEMTMLGSELPRVGANGDTATRWKALTGINTGNTHMGVSEAIAAVRDFLGRQPHRRLLQARSGRLGRLRADYASRGPGRPQGPRHLEPAPRRPHRAEKSVASGQREQRPGHHAHADRGERWHRRLHRRRNLQRRRGRPVPDGLDRAGGFVAVSATGAALTQTVPQQITKTNVDGTTDTINAGAAQKSATAGTTTSGSTSVITASVAVVDGAAGYAWFVGTAGGEKLVAITSINSVSITILPNSGNQALSALAAADHSADATYNMDGIWTYARASLNATVVALPTGTAGVGTTLTASGRNDHPDRQRARDLL